MLALGIYGEKGNKNRYLTSFVKNYQKNYMLIVKKGIDFFAVMWYDVNDISCLDTVFKNNFMEI